MPTDTKALTNDCDLSAALPTLTPCDWLAMSSTLLNRGCACRAQKGLHMQGEGQGVRAGDELEDPREGAVRREYLRWDNEMRKAERSRPGSRAASCPPPKASPC